MVDDDTLMRQVHEQLATNNDFNYVKISVKNGIVTLEGVVPRKEDRKQAKQLAQSVPGVRSVKEKLSIGQGAASASAGSEGGIAGAGNTNPETTNNTTGSIAGNASAATGTTAGTASMGQAGASTSSAPSTNPGTTPGSSAGSAPANTAGTTTPDVGTNLPDNASLQGEIEAAFKNDPNLKKDGVVVNVTNDSIELTGSAASGKDRQTAKSIAESYAGNRKVVDHIEVR